MTYLCKIGLAEERIEAESPAHAAQEMHYRFATRYDRHVLRDDDGLLTVYGIVKVEGRGEWICRTYLRPLRRKGGVANPKSPRKTVADIERDMGLGPGELSGTEWILEEADWR